jgi:hypothetical protein
VDRFLHLKIVRRRSRRRRRRMIFQNLELGIVLGFELNF